MPYETLRLEAETLEQGKVRVESEGEAGRRQEVYEVVGVDGVETERNLWGTRVITPPVTRVEMRGAAAGDKGKKESKTAEEKKAV